MFTEFHFLRFSGRAKRWWIFTQMPKAPGRLRGIKGLVFAKLLGTGAGQGFSLWPDFSVYCLLTVWQSEGARDRFHREHPFWLEVLEHSQSQKRLRLRVLRSKGSWQGENPFRPEGSPNPGNYLAVLTRASIRPRLLHRFWWEVPAVSRQIYRQPGHLFSKGIGEWPLIEQATLSLWEGEQVMQHFAYQQEKHRRVVQQTRRLNWYREELFARFAVEEFEGFDLLSLPSGADGGNASSVV